MFSLSSWWKFGWDITLESDDQFRRFYKLDNILLTDRVNQVFLVGQSDRNYFSARAYHFGRADVHVFFEPLGLAEAVVKEDVGHDVGLVPVGWREPALRDHALGGEVDYRVGFE